MFAETMAIEHWEEIRAEPVEPSKEILLWKDSKERTVRIGTNLPEEFKKTLMEFLLANNEIFACFTRKHVGHLSKSY